MPRLRIQSLAFFLCGGAFAILGLAAGEALAQGMTPLRVDPALLGLPPADKNAPAPAKPGNSAERARPEARPAEARPVEAQTLETRSLPDAPTAEVAPAAPARRPATPPADQVPSRPVAPTAAPQKPATTATPAPQPVAVPPPQPAAAPAPQPATAQPSPPVSAAASPRPRDDDSPRSVSPTEADAGKGAPAQTAPQGSASGKTATGAASAATAPLGLPAPPGNVTTMTALRVHPALLGLPVAPSEPSAPGKTLSSQLAAGAAYAPPATLSGQAAERNNAWRAGKPPLLTFDDEALTLPDGATPTLALRKDRTLEPIQAGGQAIPVFLTADEMWGTTDHEAVALGDAEARKGGIVVNAERLTYWPVEDELDAVGKVRLTKGDDLITGPHMRMKMADETGVFDQPEYFLKRESTFARAERKKQEKGAKGSTIVAASGSGAAELKKLQMSRPAEGSLMNVLGISSEDPPPLPLTEAHGSADRMNMEGENRLRMFNASYTTCKPGDSSWYLKTDELALDYDSQVGNGKDGTLYFQNVPILYAPWLSFSLNDQRKSGFLPPTIGTSSINGLTLTAPYYWNIAPNMDATIAPREYAKRGFQIGSEFRYLDPNYRGDIRSEYLPSDRLSNNDDRYAYSLRHLQNLGYGMSGSLNISGVSDDKYFTDLGTRSVLTSQRQLLRQGTLSYGQDWWSATVVGQDYQTLNPDPKQTISKPYTLAPQVTVNARRPDFYRADAAFFGQYSNFVHSRYDAGQTWDQGRRTVLYPQISMPFVQPGWYVTPKVGVNATNYSLDRRTSNTTPESISRTLPILSVDSGMTFERDTTWFGAKATQTLEPRLYYLYVPYKNQNQIPNFDSAVADFNFATIFSENQFLGYDRINNANQLTAAITTRLVDPTSGAEAMRAMFGQRYYFSQPRVTLNNQTVGGETADRWQKSDFITAFSGRILPKTYLDAALQYDVNQSRMERSSVTTRYQPELGKVLNVSYRFASQEVASGALKNIDVAGQWPIWGGWSAVGRYNYSMLDHKPVETLGGLEYNAGCWAVRVVANQVVTTTGRTNSTFFAQLELTDFARIGTDPIDLLRRNVQGFGLANESIANPAFGK